MAKHGEALAASAGLGAGSENQSVIALVATWCTSRIELLGERNIERRHCRIRKARASRRFVNVVLVR